MIVSICIQVIVEHRDWYLYNSNRWFYSRTFEQENFRYGIYRILRETENGLQLVSDNSRIVENKHILAYVSGLGFGIMSGAFALVNILADSVSWTL